MENYLKQVIKYAPKYKDLFGKYKRFVMEDLMDLSVKTYNNLMSLPEIRLPYPEMCLEFPATSEEGGLVKVCLFLNEVLKKEEIEGDIRKYHMITFAPIIHIRGAWYISHPFKICSDYWWEALTNEGYHFVVEYSPKFDLTAEAEQGNVLFLLKSALSFLNLFYEKGTIVTALNTQQKRKALGLSTKGYDSYHILKLNKPSKNYLRKHGTGTHKPPREHERSGHWRRQHTREGVKKIFIEKTIVNKGYNPRVHKDYAVVGNTNHE